MANTGPQVRISEALMAELREYVAEDTKRYGGAKKATPFGELLERAWAVYRGRPEPPPDPDPEPIAILKKILEDCSDDLRENIRHYATTARYMHMREKGEHD